MDFYKVLDKVQDLLKQRGRVSYWALQCQFHLDNEFLRELTTAMPYVTQERLGR